MGCVAIGDGPLPTLAGRTARLPRRLQPPPHLLTTLPAPAGGGRCVCHGTPATAAGDGRGGGLTGCPHSMTVAGLMLARSDPPRRRPRWRPGIWSSGTAALNQRRDARGPRRPDTTVRGPQPRHPSSPPSPWSPGAWGGLEWTPYQRAIGRVDEGPVGGGRSSATLAAEHLGSTWWPSSVSQPGGVDCAGSVWPPPRSRIGGGGVPNVRALDATYQLAPDGLRIRAHRRAREPVCRCPTGSHRGSTCWWYRISCRTVTGTAAEPSWTGDSSSNRS